MTKVRRGVRLGVDVGQVRVGLASSDPDGLLATPVATLVRDLEGGADQDDIVAHAREVSAIEVVVGLPRSLSGGEGLAADRSRDYAAALRRRARDIPVRLMDERLTTVSAAAALRASGRSAKKGRAVVDQAAAVALLQGVLDTSAR